eukprot:1959219-Pyramimonas_sp.AAC.1
MLARCELPGACPRPPLSPHGSREPLPLRSRAADWLGWREAQPDGRHLSRDEQHGARRGRGAVGSQ